MRAYKSGSVVMQTPGLRVRRFFLSSAHRADWIEVHEALFLTRMEHDIHRLYCDHHAALRRSSSFFSRSVRRPRLPRHPPTGWDGAPPCSQRPSISTCFTEANHIETETPEIRVRLTFIQRPSVSMNHFADARSCPQELFDRMPGAEPECRTQRVVVRKHLLDPLMGMRQGFGSVPLDGGLRHAPDVDLFHGGGSIAQYHYVIGTLSLECCQFLIASPKSSRARNIGLLGNPNGSGSRDRRRRETGPRAMAKRRLASLPSRTAGGA